MIVERQAKREGKKIAKIACGLVIILVIGLGIAIYTEHRPKAPPEEAVQPGLERAEEIIEEDEEIKVPPEEAICPEKEGKEERVDRLVQELRDEDLGVRSRAGGALAKIGKPAVKPLTAALRDECRRVR